MWVEYGANMASMGIVPLLQRCYRYIFGECLMKGKLSLALYFYKGTCFLCFPDKHTKKSFGDQMLNK